MMPPLSIRYCFAAQIATYLVRNDNDDLRRLEKVASQHPVAISPRFQ